MGFSGPIVPNLLRANNASLVEKHCSQGNEDCANSDLHRILERSSVFLLLATEQANTTFFSLYLPQVLSAHDGPAHENLPKPCKTTMLVLAMKSTTGWSRLLATIIAHRFFPVPLIGLVG
jgi:hypothetical protein